MTLNFKLSQILFLLVAVPLAFELILIGTSMSLSTSPEAAQRYEMMLLAGVLANIGVSVWLAFYFARTIRERLGVIKDNMHRLTSGEQLNPKLKGIDEIADLDAAFHEMAAKIQRP